MSRSNIQRLLQLQVDCISHSATITMILLLELPPSNINTVRDNMIHQDHQAAAAAGLNAAAPT